MEARLPDVFERSTVAAPVTVAGARPRRYCDWLQRVAGPQRPTLGTVSARRGASPRGQDLSREDLQTLYTFFYETALQYGVEDARAKQIAVSVVGKWVIRQVSE